MSGTILLIGMIVCGLLNVTPWSLLPGAVAAAFIGIHNPPEKAETAKNRGNYSKIIMSSLPLHLVLVGIFYGVGWGVSLLFD